MQAQHDVKEVLKRISDLIGGSFVISEGRIVFFDNSSKERFEPVATVKELEQLLGDTHHDNFKNQIGFHDGQSFEVPILVRGISGPDPEPYSESAYFSTTDSREGITYKVGVPSSEYLIHVIMFHRDLERIRFVLTPETHWEVVTNASCEECGGEKLSFSVFRLLNGQRRFFTLRIELTGSAEPNLLTSSLPESEFEALAASLIFQLSYNTREAIFVPTSFDVLISECTSRHDSEYVDRAEIQPPRKIYIKELVYLYQTFLASNNPAAQFLALYQILEYFFESVVERHSISALRQHITAAGFSHRRDHDIAKIVEIVNEYRKYSPGSGQVAARELEGLKLTIKDYLDFDALLRNLKASPLNLLDYLKSESVPFVQADLRLDLEKLAPERRIAKLADRIYRTRNAVVHSKSGRGDRFTPFKDDSYLAKEIMLVKAIAEQVIERNSTVLNLVFLSRPWFPGSAKGSAAHGPLLVPPTPPAAPQRHGEARPPEKPPVPLRSHRRAARGLVGTMARAGRGSTVASSDRRSYRPRGRHRRVRVGRGRSRRVVRSTRGDSVTPRAMAVADGALAAKAAIPPAVVVIRGRGAWEQLSI